MEFPQALTDQFNQGNAVLFLGSGASIGAVNGKGEGPPSGQQLSEVLADKFLGGAHRDSPLQIVAVLAPRSAGPSTA